MNIFKFLDDLQVDLNKLNSKEIEEKYYKKCSELSGQYYADKIKDIDLTNYTNNITEKFVNAIELAETHHAKAIYFEYDMDNNWDSAFYLCDEYNSMEAENEDWACEYDCYVEGIGLKEFSNLYNIYGFEDTEIAIGINMYLIVRTVCALKKAIEESPIIFNLPFCVAFHDQEPIFRIKE